MALSLTCCISNNRQRTHFMVSTAEQPDWFTAEINQSQSPMWVGLTLIYNKALSLLYLTLQRAEVSTGYTLPSKSNLDF